MTLQQLTATAGETVRSPQSGSELVESSKHQPNRFPLDLSSPTRSEGGLFPSLKSQAKKSEYENATDDERKRDEVAEAVDVRREQEQVRQIMASAAALQAETMTATKMDKIRIAHRDLCWDPTTNIRWATAENSATTDGANSILV